MLVRVNANVKARSLTELKWAKKTMHVAAFRYLMGELDKELRELAAGQEAQERTKADNITALFGVIDFELEGKQISRGGTVEALCEGIMEDCRAILTKHEGLPAADLLDDGVYRSSLRPSRRRRGARSSYSFGSKALKMLGGSTLLSTSRSATGNGI